MGATTSSPAVRDPGTPEVETPEPAVVEVEPPGESVPGAEHPDAVARERPEVAVPEVETPESSGVVEEARSTAFPVWEVVVALVLGLVATWAAVFVPPGLGLVLAAWIALPVAIVAVPWLVSLVAAALVDRGL